MPSVLDRFLKYIRIPSQAAHDAGKVPSTPGQMTLARELGEELKSLGLADVVVDEHAYVTATLPGNTKGAPVIAFMAHLDTALEVTDDTVRPRLVENYDGGEIILNASNGRISLDRVAAAGALSAVTSNSSIQVERVAAASVTLRSSNGGIRGVLPGRQADWAITSSTSNGKNSLPRQQAGGRPLDVRTSNASIDIRFEEG